MVQSQMHKWLSATSELEPSQRGRGDANWPGGGGSPKYVTSSISQSHSPWSCGLYTSSICMPHMH
jgi:hypothetical protein